MYNARRRKALNNPLALLRLNPLDKPFNNSVGPGIPRSNSRLRRPRAEYAPLPAVTGVEK